MTTEDKRREVYNKLFDFLDEKAFSFSEKMRVKRAVMMLEELNSLRTIQFNHKYNLWEIKGKNDLFYSEDEARLFDILERMFYPEEVDNKHINEKVSTIVRMLYKLFDYGEEKCRFNRI